MADNFDMKKFLTENKLGSYARLKTLNESEKIYVYSDDGYTCYRVDDEGNRDEVSISYCKMYADQGVREKKEEVKEDIGGDIGDAEAEKQMDFLAEREVIYYMDKGICYKTDDEGNFEEVDWSYCKRYDPNYEMGKYNENKINEAADQAKVQEMYDKITAVIAKAAKKLSDDDASALHDKLKSFFNKLFEGKKQVKESIDLNKIASADDKLRRLISNISTNSNIPTADKEGLLDALSELQDFVDEVGFDAEVEQDDKTPVSDYSRRRQSELSEESVRMFKSDNPEGDKLVLQFLKGIAKKFDYPVQQAALFVKERIKKLGY
jgi:hypothetical protein